MPPSNVFSQPTDQDALRLTHAIALTESGHNGSPNYNAVGDNGTSHGAYQWQPGNFEAAAKEAGLDPTDRSPTNQDKVAYYQVKKYKDQGLDPGQIASTWNSGSPNNWKDHAGTTIVNGKPLSYDTPAYVNKVQTHYQELLGSQPQSSGQATPPSVVAPAAPQPAPKEDFLNRAGDVLNSIFPAKNIGEAIGTGLAHLFAKPDEQQYIAPSKATFANVAGDVAQNALYFAPIGRAAGLATKGIEAVAPRLAGGAVARVGGQLAAGAGTGYALDVANSASNDNLSLTPGVGTALGAGAALAGPALRGAGNLAAHTFGGLTGVGSDVIKAGYTAASEGGAASEAFNQALKKNTSPESIVQSAKSAVSEMAQNRSDAYNAGLKKIENETFTTKAGQTYIKKFDPELNKTLFVPTNLSTKGVKDVATRTLKSIGLDAKGRAIDFSNRPSLDAKGIQKIHNFVYNWQDMTPTGLNQLRQEVAGFRKGGINLSPADNRFNTYVDNLTTNIRNYVGDRVPQVREMNTAYAKSTGVIDEITKGLSLGDRTQTDTAFRKLTTVLRTNNELRNALLNKLEDEASRNLPAQIAGQQLSELFPRGLARTLDTTAGIGGLLAGVHVLPLLAAGITTSPRAVGEVIRGLGFTTRQANVLGKALGAKGLLFPAVGIVNASRNNKN